LTRSIRLFALFLVLAPGAVPAEDVAGTPAVNFTVADGRAEDDKKQKILSLMITSCSYAIQRVGDKKTPNRIDTLREDLVRIKGASLEGKTLNVSSYNIFFNNAAILRGMVYSQYGGIIPDLMKEKGAECPKEKMKGGWFDYAELTEPHSPLIVEMEASFDGQPHSVRVLYAPPRELPGNFKKPEDAQDLLVVMRKAAEALAAQLP
jgi:hypothetical protein